MAQVDQVTPHGESLLVYALAYAARGWPVFPLVPGAKVPVIPKPKDGKGGWHLATTDAAQIRAWWQRWPRANIGMPSGARSGVVIVDEDPRNGGNVSALHLPPTYTAHTPSGGRHFYYRHPGGHVPKDNTGRLAKGVDALADGAYVVLPPSILADGTRYTWDDEDQPIAELPDRLLTVLRGDAPGARERGARVTRTTAVQGTNATREDAGGFWLGKALSRANPGSRNDTGFWLACQLRDAGVSEFAAAQVMRDYAAHVPDPHSYSDREALSSLRTAYAEAAREEARGPGSGVAKPPPNIHKNDHKASGDGGEPPQITDAMLLKGEADDNGNAEAMYRLYGREFLYTPAYGWLRWVGTHWQAVPEPIVQQCAITALKKRRHAAVEAEREQIVKATKCQKERVTGCLTLFKSYVIEPDVAAFDADPDLLNCRNGVLNLHTRQLTSHDSKQRFTYCVPVDYDPQADTAPWACFILDALGGDAAAAAFMQRCAGYSLTGHSREEKMFYLYGPPRSGKGTFTETLLELLPHPLATEVDFSSFTAQRDNDSQNFDLADLKPARVVFASESNRYQSLNPAKIKSLTGGNLVRCAFKHKDMFTYRPQFKVWLVSNHQVTADADDDALWGRVLVFTFPISHLGAEDMTLKARMKAPATLRGVLAWAVEGAIAWRNDGRLEAPETIQTATREHRDAQDFTAQWVTDCCTLDPQVWSSSKMLTTSYQDWCERNGTKPVRANDLVDSLVKRFGCVAKRQAGTGARGYQGIRLGV